MKLKETATPECNLMKEIRIHCRHQLTVGLEFGAGYTSNSYSWDFKYRHRFGGVIDRSLNIDFKYIQLPILFTAKSKVMKRRYFSLSGGLSLDYLLSAKDNYIEIILEEIGLETSYPKLRPQILSRISISQFLGTKSTGRIELGMFAKYDIIPQMQIGWGFFNNLERTKNLQIGLSTAIYLN